MLEWFAILNRCDHFLLFYNAHMSVSMEWFFCLLTFASTRFFSWYHIRKPVGPFLDMDRSDQEHIWKAIGVYWPCFICGCSHVKLLDTGLFHADPHPGNLIRTPEGKLAILDFGMCVEVALHACLSAFEWNSAESSTYMKWENGY